MALRRLATVVAADPHPPGSARPFPGAAPFSPVNAPAVLMAAAPPRTPAALPVPEHVSHYGAQRLLSGNSAGGERVTASATVSQGVDPLARTREALQDERRQMPGLLGLDTVSSEGPVVRTPPLIPDLVPKDDAHEQPSPAGWRRLFARFQEERRQLADEVARLRATVGELRDEVSRLSVMVEAVQLLTGAPVAELRPELRESPSPEQLGAGPPSPVLASLSRIYEDLGRLRGELPPATGAEATERENETGARIEDRAESVQCATVDADDEPSTMPAPGLPAEVVGADAADWQEDEVQVLAEPLPLPVQPAYVAGIAESTAAAAAGQVPPPVAEADDPEADLAAPAVVGPGVKAEVAEMLPAFAAPAAKEVEVAPVEEEIPAAQASATIESAGAASTTDAVEFPAGSVGIALTVWPVLGIQRLSALEQRLAGAAPVSRVELTSYRGGEATFRITFREPAALARLLGAVQSRDTIAAEYHIDSGHRMVRVRLQSPSEAVGA